MPLSIGIVGLPNVGKSTTFNALTKAQNAEAANYPFCTIEPNRAIVTVPDSRLDRVAAITQPKKVTHATVEFVDIAGLVKGASRGEGLGNQFLGNIRETSAIIHLVRCFEDENIAHVNPKPDPGGDIEVIQTELILADIQALDRRLERLEKQARGEKAARPVLELAQRLRGHLEAGLPAGTFPERDAEEYEALSQETHLLTGKPVIYIANVNEDGLAEDNDYVKAVVGIAEREGAEMVKLCAKLEEDMVEMSDAERDEFLESLGIPESGLSQVIRKGYHALGLISYFTTGPKETRAWTIRQGWKAPQAAGVIHTDFERGFIRAEVIAYEDFVACNGESAAKAAGKMRLEGKEYVVQDGDLMYFRFSV